MEQCIYYVYNAWNRCTLYTLHSQHESFLCDLRNGISIKINPLFKKARKRVSELYSSKGSVSVSLHVYLFCSIRDLIFTQGCGEHSVTCNITLCLLVKFMQPFRRIMLPLSVMWILRNTLKMEADSSSETSTIIYPSTWYHVLKDLDLF